MWQLGKLVDSEMFWDEDLIFKTFSAASCAANNLMMMSGSEYKIKEID